MNLFQSEDPCLTSDNEDEDSIAEAETAHPAIKQGRSSFIKYNSSNKLKPKRKIVNHVNKARRLKNENQPNLMIYDYCLHFPRSSMKDYNSISFKMIQITFLKLVWVWYEGMLAIARERGKVTGWQIFLTVCFLQAARGEKFRQHDHVKQTQDSNQEIDNKG